MHTFAGEPPKKHPKTTFSGKLGLPWNQFGTCWNDVGPLGTSVAYPALEAPGSSPVRTLGCPSAAAARSRLQAMPKSKRISQTSSAGEGNRWKPRETDGNRWKPLETARLRSFQVSAFLQLGACNWGITVEITLNRGELTPMSMANDVPNQLLMLAAPGSPHEHQQRAGATSCRGPRSVSGEIQKFS